MYVKRTTFLNFEIKDQDYVYLSWENIQDAISKLLAGKNYGIIMYPTTNEDRLLDEMFSILRSENGLFLCSFYNGDDFYPINGQCKLDGDLEIYMGHQTVRPAKYFLDQRDIINISDTYYQSGILSPNYKWQKFT